MAKNSSSRWRKWVLILVILGGLLIAGVWYRNANKDAAPEYQTEKVTRGDLVQAVTASGQLNPVVNVQVGSQISGIIQKLYVDFNSTVKSNEVIAQLDPSTYRAAVQRAEADLASAKAALELARVEADRATALFTNNLLSQSDHDSAIAGMHEAQANVQLKQAALDSARVDLSRCTIYAPVDGVVISRNVDVGQTVAASFSTPTLFVIANDLSKMQIDALVSEADIGSVATNQHVNFSVDAYPYRTFHGVVSKIRYGPITNQNVVNYDAIISVNNSDLKLLPGMTANVSIIVAESNDALKVPNAALRFHPPEEALAQIETNAAPRLASAGGPPAGARKRPGGSRQGGPGGDFRRPGAGGLRGGGGGGAFGEPHSDRPGVRTVYVLDTTNSTEHPELKQVRITTGINDGVDTEVLSGLEQGNEVVTGMLLQEAASRTVNPFRR